MPYRLSYVVSYYPKHIPIAIHVLEDNLHAFQQCCPPILGPFFLVHEYAQNFPPLVDLLT